jgi:hypothetical protein
MKKAQNKNTQVSKEKSASKVKDTKATTQGKSTGSNKNSEKPIPSKAASNTNISSVTKATGKARDSSVSKPKSAGKQKKSDNNISSVFGNRSNIKSPENSKKKETKEDSKKVPIKRRNALTDSDVDKIRSLSKKTKNEPEVKISDSAAKTSGRGRPTVETSQSKGKNQVLGFFNLSFKFDNLSFLMLRFYFFKLNFCKNAF